MRRALVWTLAGLVLLMGSVTPACSHAQGRDRLPPAARLHGLAFEFQTWCNCGPVNLTMALSYYGWPHDQQTAAAWLKPRVEDKNVTPGELVAYVQQQDVLPELRALWRYGGTVDQIRALLAAGFPVIVESGFQPPGREWMGHYETVVAYDDAARTVWVYDSYAGLGPNYQGIQHTYTDFDTKWRHFNRALIVVYPQARESDVRAILGTHADPDAAAQHALRTALDEADADPGDQWAWFNAGTSAAALGRYTEAALYYDRARGWPFRMLWYQFGPFAAYYYAARYHDVLALAASVEAQTEEIEETYYWRGLAYAALGRRDEALAALDTAVSLNANYTAAVAARASLRDGSYTRPGPAQIFAPLP
jgi:tetratricopeptide (TPR) repeat protein